jgi:peptide/nickel transport system permease protein
MKKVKVSTFRLSALVLMIFTCLAIFGPFIAGDTPIICYGKSCWSVPVINVYAHDTRVIPKSNCNCILPLIPYHPNSIDHSTGAGVSPLDAQTSLGWRHRHWLGTDRIGRDIAAGMIHGTGIALKIGLLSVLFAFLIGVSAGMFGAYYKDQCRQLNILQIVLPGVLLFFGIFYIVTECFLFGGGILKALLLFAGLSVITLVLVRGLSGFTKPLNIGISPDILIVKLIEIRKSFPGIFLLLALTGIFTVPSVWNIILIITLLGWTDFARYARAETLALKEENFIITARVQGLTNQRIIFYHILPNIMPTLIVVACFSFSSAVILESTLSFLGIGLPTEEVTWGKMMAEGRNMRHWWLVVFPGMALFILILCLNIVADRFQFQNGKKLL